MCDDLTLIDQFGVEGMFAAGGGAIALHTPCLKYVPQKYTSFLLSLNTVWRRVAIRHDN